MKASTRGMLLSGLVYPGLGQMILGRMASGVILAILATVAFVVGKKIERKTLSTTHIK